MQRCRAARIISRRKDWTEGSSSPHEGNIPSNLGYLRESTQTGIQRCGSLRSDGATKSGVQKGTNVSFTENEYTSIIFHSSLEEGNASDPTIENPLHRVRKNCETKRINYTRPLLKTTHLSIRALNAAGAFGPFINPWIVAAGTALRHSSL